MRILGDGRSALGNVEPQESVRVLVGDSMDSLLRRTKWRYPRTKYFSFAKYTEVRAGPRSRGVRLRTILCRTSFVCVIIFVVHGLDSNNHWQQTCSCPERAMRNVNDIVGGRPAACPINAGITNDPPLQRRSSVEVLDLELRLFLSRHDYIGCCSARCL